MKHIICKCNEIFKVDDKDIKSSIIITGKIQSISKYVTCPYCKRKINLYKNEN